jgi:hypothetical protein
MDELLWWGGSFGGGYASDGAAIAAAGAAHEAGATARQAATEVEFLSKDVERLYMVTHALWQLLKEEHGYDDAKLQRKVMALDLAEHDEPKPPPLPCPSCSRPVSRRHPRCIYCGAVCPQDVFAR